VPAHNPLGNKSHTMLSEPVQEIIRSMQCAIRGAVGQTRRGGTMSYLKACDTFIAAYIFSFIASISLCSTTVFNVVDPAKATRALTVLLCESNEERPPVQSHAVEKAHTQFSRRIQASMETARTKLAPGGHLHKVLQHAIEHYRRSN